MMRLIRILALLSLTSASTIILTPEPSAQGPEAVFVLLNGANIPPKNYQNFAIELQNNFKGSLWIAILGGFPFDVPEPLLIDSSINNAVQELIKNGCKVDQNMPIFYAGHSLGGTVIQDYILSDNSFKSKPGKFSGLILEGSYVLRKNRAIAQTLSQSILTIGGELDGLCRITRMAESFYFNSQSSKDMTLIVSGMNHYQFVGDGQEPSFVLKHDLHAEISNEHALNQTITIISAFLMKTLNIISNHVFEDKLQNTEELLKPILDSFELEGYYFTKPPCYKDKLNKNCTIGSKWTQMAQSIYAKTFNVTIEPYDEFHPTTQLIPDYLPKIHNKCSQPFSCTLNISTYTQNIYSFEDKEFDAALNHVSANQLISKLTSVQSILFAATGKTYDFNATDGVSLCALVNNESIQWAINHAPSHTLERYMNKGTKLVVAEDKVQNFFPIWLEAPLKFKRKTNETTKETYVEVQTEAMKFSLDYFIKISAGFHFCKLLSPARALEWIYIDNFK